MTQSESDKVHACYDCGERGRAKRVLSYRGELRLYCHDEEKSCYNYARSL
jgi:hypothetical protein